MRVSLITVLFLWVMPLLAQHTISGTFAPAKEYTWLIAYHLKPGSQNYVADTAIKNGKFSLDIKSSQPTGIYRLVYAVPQDEFYFDVIYSGQENVVLHFDSSKGVTFAGSEENIPYGTYFRKINELEHEFASFYTSGTTNVREYKAIIQRLTSLQQSSEEQSKGLLANAFISANRPYIPSGYESLTDYVSNKKKHYFDGFELSNATLQASGFLIDKVTNYVFTALPLNKMTATETEMAMQVNVQTIADKLHAVDNGFAYSVFNSLWARAAGSELNELSDFIYTGYLKELALTTDNSQTVLDIEVHNRLRLGAIAPEMVWQENNTEQKLSGLDGAERYLLVFWSSQCGHCLKELPVLHKELREYPEVKVLAVGLEDDDVTWLQESGKLPNFKHIISLGKWDSDYADLYAIQRTPSYFVLDKEKKIIAKPESDSDVAAYLKANH